MRGLLAALLIVAATPAAADSWDKMAELDRRSSDRKDAEIREQARQYHEDHMRRADELARDISRSLEHHPEADALYRMDSELMLMENHSFSPAD